MLVFGPDSSLLPGIELHISVLCHVTLVSPKNVGCVYFPVSLMLGLDLQLAFISGISANVLQVEALKGLVWFSLISSGPAISHERNIHQEFICIDMKVAGVQPGSAKISLDQVKCSHLQTL